MHDIEFTDEILVELKERLASTKDAKIYRRLVCLNLKRLGYNHSQIKDILGVSLNMVTEWVKQFIKDEFSGLCTLQYDDRRISKLDPYKQEVKEHINQEMVSSVPMLQYWLKENYCIDVEQSWLGRWLKKTPYLLQKDKMYPGQSAG